MLSLYERASGGDRVCRLCGRRLVAPGQWGELAHARIHLRDGTAEKCTGEGLYDVRPKPDA